MIVDTSTAQANLLLAVVEVDPSQSDAPGLNALRDLVNGLAAYAIIAAVASVLLGGIAWALGERMGMDRASSVGKSGVLAGFGLAFLVGAASAFVNFFLETGKTASETADNGSGPRPPAVVRVVDTPDVVHDEPSAYS